VYHKDLSNIASATDEAWVLLVLENSWELWNQMADYDKRDDRLAKEDRKRTKWTSSATAAARYEGWGDYGIHAYNEFVRKVREDRSTNGKTFDALFLDHKKKEREAKSGGKKRRRDETDYGQRVVVIEHDMSFLGADWGECEVEHNVNV